MSALTPPDALRARVLAAAAAKPSPTRVTGKRVAVGLVVASIALALIVFEIAGGFGHTEGRPLTLTVAIAGGWAVVSAALTWLAIGRGGSTLPRRPVVLASAALAAPIAAFVWLHLFNGAYDEPFQRVGYRCLAYTLIIAALPLAGFFVLRRGIEPRRPAALGAAVGAVCGAWSGVVVDLWCPLTNTPHVLVGHVVPLALLGFVGAVLGLRLLGVRRSS
ncbi:MAG TPA: NrsF family protein [Labilithrix sp.]|jgi:hypothetical protein